MKKIFAALFALIPLAASAADIRVSQKNRRFEPGEVTMRAGDTMTFTNNDEFIHQMYADGLFDSDEKKPGQTLTEAFPRAGTFEVRCHIHPKMKLAVKVN